MHRYGALIGTRSATDMLYKYNALLRGRAGLIDFGQSGGPRSKSEAS
jgi:hypothetical protein